MIMHHHHLLDSWAHLDQAVQSGRPIRRRASTSDEQWRESFLMGMFNMAMNLAPRLVPLVNLAGRRRLLDLGGGPGTYAIHFCQKNPDLRAVVFDLSTTRPFAEKTIEEFGLSDRIVFKPGNYLEDEIGNGFDAVWMSHILHGEGPEDCYRVVSKAAGALRSGGLLMIHEFILDDSMDSPLFPALFSLNMLLGTPAGQSYSESHLKDMMTQAGATGIERIRFDSPNDSGLMTGRVE
jgi:SAM-dependent methyltransferase